MLGLSPPFARTGRTAEARHKAMSLFFIEFLLFVFCGEGSLRALVHERPSKFGIHFPD
jgi:hypothetical protein